jgi:hypothetical protein
MQGFNNATLFYFVIFFFLKKQDGIMLQNGRRVRHFFGKQQTVI